MNKEKKDVGSEFLQFAKETLEKKDFLKGDVDNNTYAVRLEEERADAYKEIIQDLENILKNGFGDNESLHSLKVFCDLADGTKKRPEWMTDTDVSVLGILRSVVSDGDKDVLDYWVNNLEGETRRVDKVEHFSFGSDLKKVKQNVFTTLRPRREKGKVTMNIPNN